jgi:hypothetical protein
LAAVGGDMSDRLSQGPVQVFGNSPVEINDALRQISDRLDEAKGLRGRALMFDRLRVDNPLVTKDAVNLDTGDASAVAVGANVFTKSFTSSDQTITAGGALTLTHSLGVMPKIIHVRLKNTTAEAGYSIGDELIVTVDSNVGGRGVSIVPDATNLNIRYGSDVNIWQIARKDTGAAFGIVPANWVAIFRAYA